MTSVTKYPLARSERLVIENIGDESVIYDLDTNVAHALKPLAAAVFMYADGERSLATIAELAGYRLEATVTEAEVADAVSQLQTLSLLESPSLEVTTNGISRRDALKAFAAAGAGTVLVSSVAAPVALASTCVGLDCGGGKGGITNGQYHYPQPTQWNGYAPAVNYGDSCTYTGPCTSGNCDGTCTKTTQISGCSGSRECQYKGGTWDWRTNTCTTTTTTTCSESQCQQQGGHWSGGNTQSYNGSWQCVPCDHCFGYQCCQVVCAPGGMGGGWGPGYKYSVGPEYGYAGFWGKYCTPENNTCAPHCS